MARVNFPNVQVVLVFAASDIQPLAILLLATLDGPERHTTPLSGRPINGNTARVDQNLVVSLLVLFAAVRDVTEPVLVVNLREVNLSQ